MTKINWPIAILYWSPRILGILFFLFLSLFSLDVFEAGFSLAALGSFFIHMLLPFSVLAATLVGWKYGLFGAGFFILFAIAYLVQGANFPFSVQLIIAGPALLIGILFALEWLLKAKKKCLGLFCR